MARGHLRARVIPVFLCILEIRTLLIHSKRIRDVEGQATLRQNKKSPNNDVVVWSIACGIAHTSSSIVALNMGILPLANYTAGGSFLRFFSCNGSSGHSREGPHRSSAV